MFPWSSAGRREWKFLVPGKCCARDKGESARGRWQPSCVRRVVLPGNTEDIP